MKQMSGCGDLIFVSMPLILSPSFSAGFLLGEGRGAEKGEVLLSDLSV